MGITDSRMGNTNIYLNCSVDEAMQRITQRNRTGEHCITSDYQQKLKTEHEKWISNMQNTTHE